MNSSTILGIDLGGTNLRGGLLKKNQLENVLSEKINSGHSSEAVLHHVFSFIDSIINPSVKAIGIGVPGLAHNGLVYDVVNIPSWKEIPLQLLMEERYQLPVAVNNDANCFVLGEFYFAQGRTAESMIGLTIGTGLGSGIILNNTLYSGTHGGAGEFGMIPYLDQCYEHYASGQFFEKLYQQNGETVFKNACNGDKQAIQMFEEMGMHLGNAIKTILYGFDVELIVLGGSVSKAYPYFSKKMWETIETFAFKKTRERLQIKVSELSNSGILGAAALCYNLQL